MSYLLFLSQAGGRKVLLDVIPVVWNDASTMFKSGSAARSPLLRKYLMKLTQRLGLTCLPRCTSAWRYVVGFYLKQLMPNDCNCTIILMNFCFLEP